MARIDQKAVFLVWRLSCLQIKATDCGGGDWAAMTGRLEIHVGRAPTAFRCQAGRCWSTREKGAVSLLGSILLVCLL